MNEPVFERLFELARAGVATVPSFLHSHVLLANLLSALAIVLLALGFLAYQRRPRRKPVDRRTDRFGKGELLTPPLERPAYSDRMAYVLAEMAELAYFEFEGAQGVVADALTTLVDLPDDNARLADFLDGFADELLVGHALHVDHLKTLLGKVGFQLIGTINVASTQGFACVRASGDERPYVVVAFRGTEKKVSDWLTDAKAKPTKVGNARLHTGFHEAFNVLCDDDGKTVRERLAALLAHPATRDVHGQPHPVFLTGHSLGGALATIATCQLLPDTTGACYSFGAPRVADYPFFHHVKTPVYRVVNSSDIVPNVPLGAVMGLLWRCAGVLAHLTTYVGFPGMARLFHALEKLLDDMRGYRHHGDLRYLTDAPNGHHEEVQLLNNPPVLDRAVWFVRQLGLGWLSPVKSHSMRLYRSKLTIIAERRLRRAPP